ncbi:MAG: DUF4230 domain-containing protein [Anaerovoracaceae bacterium]
MKKTKLILVGVLIIVVVLGGIYIFKGGDLLQPRTTQTSTASLVQDNLVALSEWTTLKYEYSTVIISQTERNIPLTGFAFAEAIKLIEYSGYIKAGTDLSKAEFSFDESSDTLAVRLPKSQVLDHVAETETAKVQDVKGNIFSDYPTQTIFEEINAEKEKLEKEKIDQGLLDQADARMKELLTAFFQTNGYDNAVIEFVDVAI